MNTKCKLVKTLLWFAIILINRKTAIYLCKAVAFAYTQKLLSSRLNLSK